MGFKYLTTGLFLRVLNMKLWLRTVLLFLAVMGIRGIGEAAELHQEIYLLRNHPLQNTYETLEVSYEKTVALGLTTRIVRRHP